MKTYILRLADRGTVREEVLCDEEWFSIFVTGKWHGRPVESICDKDDETKMVAFAENLHGAQLQ